MEQKLQDLLYTAANPSTAVTRWKEETAGKVVGCLPIYVPEEIIHSAGALPVGLWGGRTGIEKANAHLQGFACSLVRAVLEYGLKGTYRQVDGFVFPSTCDHIQNMSDIWAKVFPQQPKFDLVYPANRKSRAARGYLMDLYKDFQSWLEKLTGKKITPEKLGRSIGIYNKHRQLMLKLRELRAKRPGSITGGEMAGLVKASLFLPKEEFNVRLEQLLPWLEKREITAVPRAKLVLTGIMAEPEELLDIMEELGACVVADDLALGARIHRVEVSETGRPLEALVERHLRLGPCSTLFDPEKKRGRYLQQLAEAAGAQGVVFINMKFCEVEEFDYPVIKQELEQVGMHLLFLEIEQQVSSLGQLRTRLQAFVEMLA